MFPPPGPSLPSFNSLLVQGTIPHSSLFHTCISHLRTNPRGEVMILSPSRQALAKALHMYNDSWLSAHGGDGSVAGALSRARIHYPPTPAHLALFLAVTPLANTTPETRQSVRPCTLLVLHDISLYFLDGSGNRSHTASSYLSLVASALSAITSVRQTDPGRAPVAFAVIDSRLSELRLPILARPAPKYTHDDQDEDEEGGHGRRESVSLLAQRYFQWVATGERVHPHPQTPSSSPVRQPDTPGKATFRMQLRPAHDGDKREEIWIWREEKNESGTTFRWM